MKYYTLLDLARFFGLLILGSLAGFAFGHFGLGLAGGLLIWTLLQHREYVTFRRWALHPLRRPEFATDAWQAGADILFRSGRRQRTRSKRAVEMLKHLRAVTEALPDCAIVLDSNGCIERFNTATTHHLRIRRGDRGLPFIELVRHPQIVALVRNPGQRDPVEFPSPFDDGIRLEARLVPMGGNRSLMLIRDVTQLNRLLSMRQDFVANVSHELRTPLTVILGYLETLQEDDLDERTSRQIVSKIVPPAQRMHALLQDLLLLTRLESQTGTSLEGIAPVAIPGLFNRVVAQVSGISSRQHRIVVDVQSTMRLMGVPREIESALGNLLSNAIRYSPDGGEIRLSWTQTPEGCCLAVSDQGIGVAREHLARLTERFYRVDLARARVQGGTGLGLAIVKHVLKRHGTVLQIESEPGKGSRFFCHFSMAQLVPAEKPLEVAG